MCSCSLEPETTFHYLLRCNLHSTLCAICAASIRNCSNNNDDNNDLIDLLLHGSDEFSVSVNKDMTTF